MCDGYHLDVRFIAGGKGTSHEIWDALIGLTPVPPQRDHSFRIEADGFSAGQLQSNGESKQSLLALLERAASGILTVAGKDLSLFGVTRMSLYSEMGHRDRWFSDLHLRIGGDTNGPASPHELVTIDNALRKALPPFDGLVDLASWLGVTSPGSGASAGITIRINPPVDLAYDKCTLENDLLRLTLVAHASFDVTAVGLGIRAAPGNGLDARMQGASKISWSGSDNGKREGIAELHVKDADSALVMLTIGQSTVRRQWFLDATKARNNRFLAVQHFDRDLKMTKNAVLNSIDATKFENGIAALLFLLGFSPAVQLETDSPDLIVTTPGGRLALVECTTKIADFGSKLGKLVDRRGSLVKSLQASGHPTQVTAALICRAPRDQIAASLEELRKHKVILLAGDDLEAAFDHVRFPNDPDKLLQQADALIEIPDSFSRT